MIIFDLEGDGLLNTVTKIHCLSYHNIENGESGSITTYDGIRSFLLNQEVLIGHNIIRFDIPVIEKILGIEIKAKLIDTLAFSWYLYPERRRHGLEYWGETFGVLKPVVKDWKNLSIEEYVHRCEEDVKINTILYHKCMEYLNEIYEGKPDKIIGYLMFKMQCARAQEKVGWKLDIAKTKENLGKLKLLKEEKEEKLKEVMPIQRKMKVITAPAKMFKKDGTFSVAGNTWIDLLTERNLPLSTDYVEVIDKESIGNPSSSTQIKNWLYSLGWIPKTFKIAVDTKGNTKSVPQVTLDGGGICSSVQSLYSNKPELRHLESYGLISHRIGILEGFLKNVDERGYIKAEIKGLTNTLRYQHTILTNLPTVHKPYGEYIRECLIAEEGNILCGSDMSGIESATQDHYMYFFDPQYVKDKRVKGFDAHTDIAVLAGLMTSEEEKFFKWYNQRR